MNIIKALYDDRLIKIDPEKQKVIVQFRCLLKPDVMEEIRTEIMEQYKTGVIVVPNGCSVIVMGNDTEVIFENDIIRREIDDHT